jgi:hypothetical protein
VCKEIKSLILVGASVLLSVIQAVAQSEAPADKVTLFGSLTLPAERTGYRDSLCAGAHRVYLEYANDDPSEAARMAYTLIIAKHIETGAAKRSEYASMSVEQARDDVIAESDNYVVIVSEYADHAGGDLSKVEGFSNLIRDCRHMVGMY